MAAAEQILTGTTKISAISFSQQCLLCENTRSLPEGMHYCRTPWVCDECKEAIVFVKDFMKSCNKAQTMLDEMKDLD
jgi:hypothetical protein